MNGLQIFQNEAFKVRTTVKDNEPWFVAADVLRVLDVDRTSLERLDDDEKGVDSIHTPGGRQSVTIVSEPGLYALVLGSRKKEAKAFKRWVTHEVIPSIRRYGVYAARIPKTYTESLRALLTATEQIEAQARMIEEQAPKVAAADKIASADNAMTIKDFAKSLGEGPVRIFGKLHRLGIIFRNSNMDWVPYQQFLDSGYFRTHVTAIPHGEKIVNHTTALVTGKGEVWLAAKLTEAS
jgi:prophage antirepressor-like protein